MAENTRVVLWDIDGTLLHAGRVASEAFADAVREVTGRAADDHGVRMSGKTDPQIALEIMEVVGIPPAEATAALPEVLSALERLLAEGQARIRAEGRTHPGVPELVEKLHAEPRVIQSVLTGNLKPNARLKAAAFGLDRFLDFDVGAYGSDDQNREALVPIALARIEERYGQRVAPDDVWVVGDTERDLACAKAVGAKCVLVATGRYGFDELAALQADRVLADLSDTDAAMDLLLS